MSAEDTKKERVTKENLKLAVASERQVDSNDVTILDFETSPGSNIGDGFCCDILAVHGNAKIMDEDVKFDYIAKCLPASAVRAELVKSSGIFQKEYEFYTVLLAKMFKSRTDLNLAPIKAPKFYYGNNDDGVIFMENLRTAGFSLLKSKEEGLSMPEVECVVASLAAYHASSYHVTTSYPGGLEGFSNKYPLLIEFNEFTSEMQEMFKSSQLSNYATCKAVVKEHHSEELAKKMEGFEPNIWETWKTMFFEPTGSFRIIIHGDAWYHNFMFKHAKDGSVEDHRLLDFQCCRVSTPAIDLVYTILTGAAGPLRKNHFESLLQLYYRTFAADLKTFGYNPDEVYTYQNLKDDYAHVFPYGVAWAVQHVQLLLRNEDGYDIAELANLQDPKDFPALSEKMRIAAVKQASSNHPYRTRVLDLATEAEERNVY